MKIKDQISSIESANLLLEDIKREIVETEEKLSYLKNQRDIVTDILYILEYGSD